MQDFEQDLIIKLMNKNKTVYFNITNNCNAKCSHCINHEGETVLGEAKREEVLEWIGQVAETDYKIINFVGGEPFLLMDDLKKYSEYGAGLNLTVGVTTNGFWGKTKEMALDTLNKLPHVKKILVSTDFFHQEYIPIESIYNVVDACLELKRFIAVNAVCKKKEDGEQIKAQFAKYKNRVYVNIAPVMPEGSAKYIEDEIDKFDFSECEQKLSGFCNVREHYVDCMGGISACCMSTLMLNQNVLSLGDLKQERLSNILKKKEDNLIIKLLEDKGPKGLWEKIRQSPNAGKLKEKYSCDCDFCCSVLSNEKVLNEIRKNQ